VELIMAGDPIIAALDQLAACREQIARLDGREADHHAALSARLAEIAGLVTGIGGVVKDHAAALARLEAIDQHVGELAAQVAEMIPDGGNPDVYRPGPAPRWWKLTAGQRQEALGRLRAWVEQVYRPGYGQLAAGLGPCWEAHDLCLYGLDILSDLWSVLYLQPRRTAGMLSAQAEYQARILPGLAGQMMTETSRCGHAQARRPVNGRVRSTS
jgi:hypothetical protein